MDKVFGRATVKVDNEVLLIDSDAALDFGGFNRKTVKGTEVHGFAEEAKEPSVEVKASIKKGDSLKKWADISDASVTFEMDTGQIYILNHAWIEEPPKATGGEGGKVALKFVATKCEEQK